MKLSYEECKHIVDWLKSRNLEFYLESKNGLFASENFEERGKSAIQEYSRRKGKDHIEKLEAEEQEIQTEMANPDIAASFEKLGPLQEKLSAVQEQLEQANNDWENALEALDEFE